VTTTVGDIGQRAAAMLDDLGAISDDEGRLTRLYLSPAHRRAADVVAGWMTRAGMGVTMDALGTVRGSLPPGRSGPAPDRRLLVGSHIDTVVDAGRFDGALGVVAGILAVEILAARGERLPFGVDVLAFGDEEGVRFPTTLLSSSAVAGRLDPASLQASDQAGVTVEEALRAFGCDPSRVSEAAYDADDVLGYLEVHIEQGPVLEREGLAIGVVTSIAGQSRFRAVVSGEAGHAGTVPMALRRDALAAAAEMIVAIEAVGLAGETDQLVATVGHVAVEPSAVNVIPALVDFTIDVRAADDPPRAAAIAEIERRLRSIAERRGVTLVLERYHDSPTTPCAPRLRTALAEAVAGVGLPVRTLTSGAGHDGHAMHGLTDIGMLFVRSRGGISHNPAEFSEADDIGLAVLALADAIAWLGREDVRQGEGE
jgi:allantoate deiminase